MSRRDRHARSPKETELPRAGARLIDAHGVTWTVVAVHSDRTPRLTVQAGALRRTMTAERLAELEWSVA